MPIRPAAADHDHGRGLALGHLKKRARELDETAVQAPAAIESKAGPAAIVELGRAEEPSVTYAPPAASGPAAMMAEGGRIQTNIHIKEAVAGEASPAAAPGRWILEEGASLKINAHIDTLVGSGPGANIILEKGAKLTINEHIDTLHAGPDGGTIVVGENASLHLNLHAGVATTGGTIVVPDGVKAHVNVHSKSGPAPAVTLETAAAPAAEPELPVLPELAPPPEQKTPRASEKDDALDARDLRWRLLRDIVENFRRSQLEWAERNDDQKDHKHGHGKALGHSKPR